MALTTCIVVTCSTLRWATAVEAELTILQKQGIIPEDVKLLTVEDPANNIGSGAATLNALLVVTEFLSVREGYLVISSDVLASSTILILHIGREYVYEPCGKAFGHLPSVCYEKSSETKMQTNLERLFHLLQKLQYGGPPGVWVCSTDMILSVRGIENIDWNSVKDGMLFCCPSTPDYATSHGVVEVDSDGNLANILYSAPLETLHSYLHSDGKVKIVSGIVYLSTQIAESLLSLHAKSPLDSCTYLGLDSGVEPMQISLFFDLLMATATNVSKEAFVNGHCGRLYDRHFSLSRNMSVIQARSLVWDELSRYSLKIGSLENVTHYYLSHSITAETYLNYLWSCNIQEGYRHAALEVENMTGTNFIAMNSLLKSERGCKIGNKSVLRDCHISASGITIGEDSFLSGVIHGSQNENFRVPDATCVLQFEVSSPLMKHKTAVFVVLGVNDNLSVSSRASKFTIFNRSLKDFYDVTSWTANDLWGAREGDSTNSLLTALLFPIDGDIGAIISILEGVPDHLSIKRWRETERLSLQDILHYHLVTEQLARRWETYFAVAASLVYTTLTEGTDFEVLPFFVSACATGHKDTLMSVLDTVAERGHGTNDVAVVCRTFSCIADFLGVMAGKAGGLRSGPGGNRAWLGAFELLERENIAQGAEALHAERQNWTDRPDRLMRAARHYEGALQVLVRQAVNTCKQCIHVFPSGRLYPYDTWVVAECPARLDLFGGWTDTPPICYEMGGSVINVAVLVDNKRPIGAKARRLDKLHIILKLLHNNIMEEIVIENIEGLLDYNQPGACGALLKACLIGADIVRIYQSVLTLKEQLHDRYNGGIELQTWSSLPQGSGLGTSSILASAIVGALWTVTGQAFDKASVIHCVLNVEQLLTTGGGWQDQVGGVSGGLCLGFSKPMLPLKVGVEQLPLTEDFAAALSSHFLLLYTGKVRLAKNLLQTVIRNWYARDPKVVACFKELYSKCQTSAKEAFLKEDLLSIGMMMNEYWTLKKVLASGCEPQFVRQIMDLLEPHLLGKLLVGAGGGGFLCILTRKPNMLDFVRGLLSTTKGMERVTVHKVDVDQGGLSISVAGGPVPLVMS
ncbi:L-fucose kinase-like isoform X2 [Ornithodoros turicata]|uniref:L-fucose kinase-like isoform X2 n=1 Tax=Ornithodoros turicata TaxID=34597 RepID=UPI003138762E